MTKSAWTDLDDGDSGPLREFRIWAEPVDTAVTPIGPYRGTHRLFKGKGGEHIFTHDRTIGAWKHRPLKPEFFQSSYEDLHLYQDARKIDKACRHVCQSPSVRALARLYPPLLETPIYSGDIDGFAFFDLLNGDVGMNADLNDRDRAIAIVHELRHDYQNGGVRHGTRPYMGRRNEIFHLRLIEGDALAFHLTVPWEIYCRTGDASMWNRVAHTHHTASQIWAEHALADPRSVWDGRAQCAVFKNFFHSALGHHYDKTLRAHYKGVKDPRFTPEQKQAHEDYLQKLIVRISKMPWLDSGGQLRHRPHYIDDSFARALMTSSYYRGEGNIFGRAARAISRTLDL